MSFNKADVEPAPFCNESMNPSSPLFSPKPTFQEVGSASGFADSPTVGSLLWVAQQLGSDGVDDIIRWFK